MVPGECHPEERTIQGIAAWRAGLPFELTSQATAAAPELGSFARQGTASYLG